MRGTYKRVVIATGSEIALLMLEGVETDEGRRADGLSNKDHEQPAQNSQGL